MSDFVQREGGSSFSENDLRNPEIPLFPPLVLNPESIDRSRQKLLTIGVLAQCRVNIQSAYPDAFKEMFHDIWQVATDFDTYIDYVRGIILELANESRNIERPLSQSECAPFFERAKLRSAFGIFGWNKEKNKTLIVLMEQYSMMVKAVSAPQ